MLRMIRLLQSESVNRRNYLRGTGTLLRFFKKSLLKNTRRISQVTIDIRSNTHVMGRIVGVNK